MCPIVSGTVLVGDFTHLTHRGKIIYVATYMDLFTREIVGWHIATRHTKEIVLEALLDAITTLGKFPKVVHTDQGSEYCSKENLEFLCSLGIQISMSKKHYLGKMATKSPFATISKQIWVWSLTGSKRSENWLKASIRRLPITTNEEFMPRSKCPQNNLSYDVWFKLFVQKNVT